MESGYLDVIEVYGWCKRHFVTDLTRTSLSNQSRLGADRDTGRFSPKELAGLETAEPCTAGCLPKP